MSILPAPEGDAFYLDAARGLFASRFGVRVDEARLAQAVDLLRRTALTSGTSGSLIELLERVADLPLEAPIVQRLIAEVAPPVDSGPDDRLLFEGLREHVLPDLVQARRGQRALRVWSAGCASGEELYSLAILLEEMLSSLDGWSLALVGTDVALPGLRQARRAEYRRGAASALGEECRARCFDAIEGGLFRVRSRYRKVVSFHLHNLMDPRSRTPPPGIFDLIICRRLTGRLTRAGLTVALQRFRSALAPDGVLLTAPGSNALASRGFEVRAAPGLTINRPVRASGAPARESLVGPTPAAPEGHSLPEPARSIPPTVVSLLDRVRARVDAGQLPAAEQMLHDFDGETWMRPEAHQLAATVYDAMGRTDDAIHSLRRALLLDPSAAESHFQLGLLLARKQDTDGAMSALRAAAREAARDDSEDGLALQRVAKAQLARMQRLQR